MCKGNCSRLWCREKCYYDGILIYEPELREVGVVMVSCRASRERLNPPHAYHDRSSPFPMEEENYGIQAQKSEPLANTSFSPPAVLNYKHAVGIGLSPFEGLKSTHIWYSVSHYTHYTHYIYYWLNG